VTVEAASWGDLPVAAGDVLAGKYRIEKILGVGGMGAVVSATHLQLDQKVALKFMLPQGVSNQALVERFSREARAAVRLKSDHVARVLDVGTLPWGAPYMVMEYLDGADLGSVVGRDGPMSPDAAVDCVLQACDAVAEAHSLGIVHRDLKPRNLFLTQRNDGRALVKVLDFGISKHKFGGDMSLTSTSEVIGSPYYMSPEQLKSAKAADERSDIWALGIILYELMTGQVPFQGESVTALTAMVLQETPLRVDQLRPDVPRDLATVVSRCLQKDPALRYASVSELAAALQPFAPHDTKDLAARIARIGGTGRPSMPLGASSSAKISVAGSTSVNWSEPTRVATGSTRRVAWVASVAAVGVVGVVGGFFLATRAASHAPSPPSASVAAAPSALPSPGVASSLASSIAAATAPPVIPPSASDVSAAAATASSPAAGAAGSGAATASPAVTSTARPPSRGSAAPGAPAPGKTSDEPPRYRTNW
jgi:serine/threonine protein kinase